TVGSVWNSCVLRESIDFDLIENISDYEMNNSDFEEVVELEGRSDIDVNSIGLNSANVLIFNKELNIECCSRYI
ncbi:hypothetical protein L9F63_006887, partial [Diploptera punctata]